MHTHKTTETLGVRPLLLLFSLLFFSLLFSCNVKTDVKVQGKDTTATISNDSLVSRGRYLVTIMGCQDCHSPKKMGPRGPEIDAALMLSGHPAQQPLPKIQPAAAQSWMLFNQSLTATVGPWGVSFAANLTSDSTGIGNWTEQQFFTAIRKGKYKGLESNRDLLPPMPWPNYAEASDEDLRAVFAYLKSTPPVRNVVPAAVTPDKLATLSQ